MATACGMKDGAIANVLTASSSTKSFTMPVSGFTVNDKCTWMAYSVDTAPTFTIMESGASPSLGLVAAAY
jgi:hypothetical protein